MRMLVADQTGQQHIGRTLAEAPLFVFYDWAVYYEWKSKVTSTP